MEFVLNLIINFSLPYPLKCATTWCREKWSNGGQEIRILSRANIALQEWKLEFLWIEYVNAHSEDYYKISDTFKKQGTKWECILAVPFLMHLARIKLM